MYILKTHNMSIAVKNTDRSKDGLYMNSKYLPQIH